ncbi:hypothetical protein DFH08DRAFT_802574 [Mycena albidolilacea]|uniref:Uncharacterized protein n=1 Tax=Mycena albidolilacea TaxID=1033008 RepID=A0AAD7AE73_9AGAR|nr:hypothetical protein DFH08DRAFT_802574 [Mycena albidolilacea]
MRLTVHGLKALCPPYPSPNCHLWGPQQDLGRPPKLSEIEIELLHPKPVHGASKDGGVAPGNRVLGQQAQISLFFAEDACAGYCSRLIRRSHKYSLAVLEASWNWEVQVLKTAENAENELVIVFDVTHILLELCRRRNDTIVLRRWSTRAKQLESGCGGGAQEPSDWEASESFPTNSGYGLYGQSVPTIFLLRPASSVDAQPLGFFAMKVF